MKKLLLSIVVILLFVTQSFCNQNAVWTQSFRISKIYTYSEKNWNPADGVKFGLEAGMPAGITYFQINKTDPTFEEFYVQLMMAKKNNIYISVLYDQTQSATTTPILAIRLD